MKKFVLLLLVILIVSFGCTNDQSQEIEALQQENAELKALLGPPPSALDALYPPQAELPVWQMKMLEMAMPLGGTAVDFFENEFENAMANFEGFTKAYEELSKLVPEWEQDFKMEPVEAVKIALETRDLEKILPAFEELNLVCTDCHLKNMVKVQHKYQWKDFRTIKVFDPLDDNTVDFKGLMQNLDLNFVGIMVDLQEGQLDKARNHFEGFNTRFQTLKDTCIGCHGGPEEDKQQVYERKYFVDDNVQAMVDNLGKILSGDTIDPKMIEEIGMGIGMESCFKCHWVHVPSMYAKYNWEKMEEK
jgi:hypothetical protein